MGWCLILVFVRLNMRVETVKTLLLNSLFYFLNQLWRQGYSPLHISRFLLLVYSIDCWLEIEALFVAWYELFWQKLTSLVSLVVQSQSTFILNMLRNVSSYLGQLILSTVNTRLWIMRLKWNRVVIQSKMVDSRVFKTP